VTAALNEETVHMLDLFESFLRKQYADLMSYTNLEGAVLNNFTSKLLSALHIYKRAKDRSIFITTKYSAVKEIKSTGFDLFRDNYTVTKNALDNIYNYKYLTECAAYTLDFCDNFRRASYLEKPATEPGFAPQREIPKDAEEEKEEEAQRKKAEEEEKMKRADEEEEEPEEEEDPFIESLNWHTIPEEENGEQYDFETINFTASYFVKLVQYVGSIMGGSTSTFINDVKSTASKMDYEINEMRLIKYTEFDFNKIVSKLSGLEPTVGYTPPVEVNARIPELDIILGNVGDDEQKLYKPLCDPFAEMRNKTCHQLSDDPIMPQAVNAGSYDEYVEFVKGRYEAYKNPAASEADKRAIRDAIETRRREVFEPAPAAQAPAEVAQAPEPGPGPGPAPGPAPGQGRGPGPGGPAQAAVAVAPAQGPAQGQRKVSTISKHGGANKTNGSRRTIKRKYH
jgi:hypothetical protein